jgi:hypothetical protein
MRPKFTGIPDDVKNDTGLWRPGGRSGNAFRPRDGDATSR